MSASTVFPMQHCCHWEMRVTPADGLCSTLPAWDGAQLSPVCSSKLPDSTSIGGEAPLCQAVPFLPGYTLCARPCPLCQATPLVPGHALPARPRPLCHATPFVPGPTLCARPHPMCHATPLVPGHALPAPLQSLHAQPPAAHPLLGARCHLPRRRACRPSMPRGSSSRLRTWSGSKRPPPCTGHTPRWAAAERMKLHRGAQAARA